MPKVSRKRRRSVSTENSERILKALEGLERRMQKLERKKPKTRSASESEVSDSDSASHSRSTASSAEENEYTMDGGLTNETAPTRARSGLKADVLSLLGAEVVTDVSYGPPIHQDVGDRWLHIIKVGLDEDGRNELIKKYPAPENSKNFGVPKLNPLVKHAAVDLVIKRDERLVRQQAQVSASLSAISKTITILLKKEEGGGTNEGDTKEVIEHLGDTGRLLADIHHTFSVSRRDLVSLNLNKDLKDPLMDSPIDEWLFGEDLNERLKTAKDLQASSKQLLIAKHPTKKAGTSKTNLNWKGPLKRIQGARKSGPYNQAPSTSKYQVKYRSTYQKQRSRNQDERRSRRQ